MKMRHISQEASALLKDMPPQFAKKQGLMPLYQAFINCVRITWADNPPAANYLLAKVNAVYLRTEEPRGGRLRDKPITVFEVMLSDAMSRSELNARRESLRLQLALCGYQCDEFRIGASKRGMLQRHPLEKLLEVQSAPVAPSAAASTGKKLRIVDEREALAILRRACVIVFEEEAPAVAAPILRAHVTPVPFAGQPTEATKASRQRYYCDVTVGSVAAQQKLSASAEALRDKCYRLGLPRRKLSFHLEDR